MNTDEHGCFADWPQVNRISERIIGCAFAVSNGLGSGFLDKVYENALAHELRKSPPLRSAAACNGRQIRWVVVGEYVADLLVDSHVLVAFGAMPELSQGTRAAALPPAQLCQAPSRDPESFALKVRRIRVYLCSSVAEFFCGSDNGDGT